MPAATATADGDAPHGTLPNEPSQQEDRAAEGLPPKTYADAAHEAVDGVAVGKENEAGGARAGGKDGLAHKTSVRHRGKKHKGKGGDVNGATGGGNANGATAHGDKADAGHANGGHANGANDTTADASGANIHAANANAQGEAELVRQFEPRGDILTTTQAPKTHHADKNQAATTDKTNSLEKREQLTMGRKAGQRWHTSAVRWAPLNVPVQRRLQTLMVLWHTVSIGVMLALFFFLCTIPIFWPLLVPYLVYTLFSQASVSGELSHRSERFRRSSLWSLFASYFPARLHRTVELEPGRKYIFGYHPHGIISHGAFSAFATEALGFAQLFPGITNSLLTLDANFRLPFYRDYILGLGIASVSRESCENLLNKGGSNGEGMGRAITIVVGGAREALEAEPHKFKLVLNRRKGFVKLAIRNGADLVPVVGFGENDLYEQVGADKHPMVHRFQLLVKKAMGFTIPLFHARGIFNYDVGLLPYRRPMNIVVGRPISVERVAKPTEAQINEVHAQYVAELQRVWDTWKDHFAKDRESELDIIE